MTWSNPERRHSIATLRVVAVLLTVGEVHSLKCVTTDHSRRQGDFINLAEQCNNASAVGRPATGHADRGEYFSSLSGAVDRRNGDDGNSGNNNNNGNNNGNNNSNSNSNNNNNRRNADNGDGRRNNNREFSVRRQDYGDGGSGNDNNNNNNNRGGIGAEYINERGNFGDRDSAPSACDHHPPPRNSGHHNDGGGRPVNRLQQQGHAYYSPDVDYDGRQQQPNFSSRRPQNVPRRYRRRRAATSGSYVKLLGNNRFRNVTNGRAGNSQTKTSILDQMDACTIHCVFNQLEMLNMNSRPDKSSIANIMTNHIKDVELKEFIQDSIDECFDTLELDSHSNKCEFSKNFAVCMENKAQKNCDDWNENGFANKINSAQNENSHSDKRRGY